MKCPTCGKVIVWEGNEWRPFCSERCKMIDFGRWANEEYRVPSEDRPSAEQMESPAPSAQGDEKQEG
ncbi:MAG: DNA gyrase inhibitor YacG [Acidobacteria bacterium 13_1_20CM_3_53_8]|nr:MAG: DNA gyrase inhibitor YacG [Acidobacteria bacterium 13_1_20CM_3_53_8]